MTPSSSGSPRAIRSKIAGASVGEATLLTSGSVRIRPAENSRNSKAISSRITPGAKFEYYDTICRNVTKRIPNILKFARENDMVVFVSGRKSSNGKELYEHCRQVNPRTYFVTSPDDLDGLELDLTQRIGICGATSTPAWLMEAVAEKIKGINKKD